jgi:hypothetical protein
MLADLDLLRFACSALPMISCPLNRDNLAQPAPQDASLGGVV